ncbi:hypothetical protein VCHA53O466_50440 [Vibrio chagasii]|nr:hypothetical protein VCHA53O466_50440 [Vibrio chagasii]
MAIKIFSEINLVNKLPPLTEKQKNIFESIFNKEMSGGGVFTISELTKHHGFRSGNATQEHVHALRMKGYLKGGYEGKSRSIQVSDLFLSKLEGERESDSNVAAVSDIKSELSMSNLIHLKLEIEREIAKREQSLDTVEVKIINRKRVSKPRSSVGKLGRGVVRTGAISTASSNALNEMTDNCESDVFGYDCLDDMEVVSSLTSDS